MREPSPGTAPQERALADRLSSWKEIAAYLKRDVTTVQRWEKREGMPVHRHQHDRMGTVYASRAELDAWVQGRNLPPPSENGQQVPASPGVEAEPPSVAPPSFAQQTRAKWPFVLLLLAVCLITSAVLFWQHRAERTWRNPLADARYQTVTDFDGMEQSAAVSRDGHFIAFLSDRDGQTDVWVTQVGSGEFHNLTHGSMAELTNPSLRVLGFSPDGSLVTFWVIRRNQAKGDAIGVWAVPTLGGQPRPYLEGVAEYDWSPDGSRLAYHTPGPGDPLYVAQGGMRPGSQPIFAAAAGLHGHFPLWAPDAAFLYFVQGEFPGKTDIWRIRPSGGIPERITFHNEQVTYPVLLDRRTLLYLAGDLDHGGQSLYGMDVERRVAHPLFSGLDQYTSLAASADGRRLVVTRTTPERTFWRMRIADTPVNVSKNDKISLTTTNGFSPRLGPDYLLYVSATGDGESIWKLANGTSTELWHASGVHVVGAPAITRDGSRVTFATRQNDKTNLYVMMTDGTNTRLVASSLDLQGAPAWAPNGDSVLMAAQKQGVPQLFRIPVDGQPPTLFAQLYALDPAWSQDGTFVVYSGPDIGTSISVKAMVSGGSPYSLPPLTVPRGARHVAFLPGRNAFVLLRGGMQHKNLWLVDLDTHTDRQLTDVPSDFEISDFDVSSDGREVVLEQMQRRSNVAIVELSRP